MYCDQIWCGYLAVIYVGHLLWPPKQPHKIKFVENIYWVVCPSRTDHLLLLNVLSHSFSVIMWFKQKGLSSYTSCPDPRSLALGGCLIQDRTVRTLLKGLNLGFKTGVSPVLLTKLEDVSLEAVGRSCFMFQRFMK